MVEIADEKILEEMKNGNEFAVELMFAKYAPLVTSIARRYFLVGAEQEDLVQEGMIGLYKATVSYKSGMNFASFARLCIKRQIQSAVKAANRQRNITLNNALSLDSYNGIVFVSGSDIDESKNFIYIPSVKETPETELIEKENYEETLNKIEKALSEMESEILKLYIDGYQIEQIAERVGKNYKSVDNALFRIKTKLRF